MSFLQKLAQGRKLPPPKQPSVADDVLRDIKAIARYVEGRDDPSAVRRIRYLHERHDLPIKKVGGRYQARRSKIDEWLQERLG